MNNFWSIAGLVGTVFFGVLSIILAVIALRKNSIKHFKINSYEIGKGLMERYPKLGISYDNKKIEKNFTVIEGGFINTGSDIKSDDIKFDMILPEKCQIIDVNIKPSNDKLIVISTIDNNNKKLHYEIEKLFLHNDYFNYSIIVESDEVLENIVDKFTFEHRMYKTKKITALSGIFIKNIPSKKEMIATSIFCLICALLFAFLFIDFCYLNKRFPADTYIGYSVAVLCFLLIVCLCLSVFDYKRFKKLWVLFKY